MKQSIWRASSENIEQYRKYDSISVINDVVNEFKQYASFNGVDKRIILGRMMNIIKQSLRVRGINVLFRMRARFMIHENHLTCEIRKLNELLKSSKSVLTDNCVDINDPNTTVASVIKHYQLREHYLEAKIRLESKILERKSIREHLKVDANDILKEHL